MKLYAKTMFSLVVTHHTVPWLSSNAFPCCWTRIQLSPLSWQKRFHIKNQILKKFTNARGDLQTIQQPGLARNKTGSVAAVIPYVTTEPSRSTEGWVGAFGNSALKEIDRMEIQ